MGDINSNKSEANLDPESDSVVVLLLFFRCHVRVLFSILLLLYMTKSKVESKNLLASGTIVC